MRLLAFILAWAALSTVVLAEDGQSPKTKKPPPLPGIWWQKDYAKGMQRAMSEGRPILFAINALETERANNQLAQMQYQSAAWGEATRGYVPFVCNPNNHKGPGEQSCSRYPGHDCAQHQVVLQWFTSRFGDALISPQHVILEPDGDVAFRKEYYTGVVKPALLDAYLSNISPRIAYARAGIVREAQVKRFAKLPLEQLDEKAAGYLSGTDGLAAAALLNVLDDTYDAKRRAALIRALRHTHDLQVPVLIPAAEERVLYPADEPAETLLWIATLFEADRPSGVWAATRALVRLESEAERDRVLRLWAGSTEEGAKPGIDDLPEDERPNAYEALILAKDRRGLATKVSAAWKKGRENEIARALRKVGRTTATTVDLDTIKDGAAPAVWRPALLSMTPEAVRAQAQRVAWALKAMPSLRLRVAAALALLRGQLPQGGTVVQTILAGIDDLVEGRETRALAVRILGDDPGRNRAALVKALDSFVKGGAK